MAKQKIKILIAIINNQKTVPVYVMKSILNIHSTTKKEYPNTDVTTINANDVSLMRNYACREAEIQGYDYVYQVDTDMDYPADSIIKLIKHKKDFVVGSANTRTPPYPPTQYKRLRSRNISSKGNLVFSEGEKLIKIQGTGVCGALIKTSIFKKLKYPFFQVTYKKYPDIVGEDIRFCFILKYA